MTDDEMVMRNGCFTEDGGTTWKSRLWFIDCDRATGELFSWSFDAPVPGVTLAVRTAFQGPAASAPDLTFRAETPSHAPYVPDTSLPVITVSTEKTIEQSAPLNIPLRVNRIYGTWTLTGAGASEFTVGVVNKTRQLQFSGANSRLAGSYPVTVNFVDSLGNVAVPVNVSVTVSAAATEFSDTFTGTPGASLANRAGYEYISGLAGKLIINTAGNGVSTVASTAGTNALRLPDIGRTNNFIIRARWANAASLPVRIGSTPTTGPRFSIERFTNDSLTLVHWNDGAGNTLTWRYANPNSNLVELRYSNRNFEVYYNGVRQAVSSGPTQETITLDLPTDARFYLMTTDTAARANVLDDLYIGPV